MTASGNNENISHFKKFQQIRTVYGHLPEGHLPDGHSTNGHEPDGHSPDGHLPDCHQQMFISQTVI